MADLTIPEEEDLISINLYLENLHTDLSQKGYGTILAAIPRHNSFKFIPQENNHDEAVHMEVGVAGGYRFHVGPNGSCHRINPSRWTGWHMITNDRPYPQYMEIFAPFRWSSRLMQGLRAPMTIEAQTLVRYYCLLWATENHDHGDLRRLTRPRQDDLAGTLDILRKTLAFRTRSPPTPTPLIMTTIKHEANEPMFRSDSRKDEGIEIMKSFKGPPSRKDWTTTTSASNTLPTTSTVQSSRRTRNSETNRPQVDMKLDRVVGGTASRANVGPFLVSDDDSVNDTSMRTYIASRSEFRKSSGTSDIEPEHPRTLSNRQDAVEDESLFIPHDLTTSNNDKNTTSEVPKFARENRSSELVQPGEVASKQMCDAGPRALPFLRETVAELSNLPKYSDMVFEQNKKLVEYQPARLLLGHFIGDDYVEGKLWAYLARSKGDKVGPKHSIQMDYLASALDRDYSALQVRFRPPGLKVADFKLVSPFSLMDDAHFYALIKYYFLLARDADYGGLTEDSIPVNPTFIQEIRDSMKVGGYLRQQRARPSAKPAHAIERRIHKQARLSSNAAQIPNDDIVAAAAVVSSTHGTLRSPTIAVSNASAVLFNDDTVATGKIGDASSGANALPHDIVMQDTEETSSLAKSSSKVGGSSSKAALKKKSRFSNISLMSQDHSELSYTGPDIDMLSATGSLPTDRPRSLATLDLPMLEPSTDITNRPIDGFAEVQQATRGFIASPGSDLGNLGVWSGRDEGTLEPNMLHTEAGQFPPPRRGDTDSNALGRLDHFSQSTNSFFNDGTRRRPGSIIRDRPTEWMLRCPSSANGSTESSSSESSSDSLLQLSRWGPESGASNSASGSMELQSQNNHGKRPRLNDLRHHGGQSSHDSNSHSEDVQVQEVLVKEREVYKDRLNKYSIKVQTLEAKRKMLQLKKDKAQLKEDETRKKLDAITEYIIEYQGRPLRKKPRNVVAEDENVGLLRSNSSPQRHQDGTSAQHSVKRLQQSNAVSSTRGTI